MPRPRSLAVATAALVILASPAAAQTFPSHNIEMVVPSTPGSSADILGRVLGDGMGARLGQHFIILNKPGASSTLGAADVARAKPDGHTLMHTAVFAITVQPLTLKTAYTPQSFTPICQTFKNDQVIVARQGIYKDLAALIAASKAKAGGLNYGSPGIATIPHLSMAELSQISKVPFNHVPFKGPAESISMTLGGQIDFAAAPLTAAATSGLAMVALFAEKRNPAIPDVPTVKEQGFDVSPLSIGGILGPAGMPADVTKRLEAACIATRDTEPFQKIVQTTFQPADYFADAAGFKANLDKDIAEKKKLITSLGMVKN